MMKRSQGLPIHHTGPRSIDPLVHSGTRIQVGIDHNGAARTVPLKEKYLLLGHCMAGMPGSTYFHRLLLISPADGPP
jgi:hypothetical protein